MSLVFVLPPHLPGCPFPSPTISQTRPNSPWQGLWLPCICPCPPRQVPYSPFHTRSPVYPLSPRIHLSLGSPLGFLLNSKHPHTLQIHLLAARRSGPH